MAFKAFIALLFAGILLSNIPPAAAQDFPPFAGQGLEEWITHRQQIWDTNTRWLPWWTTDRDTATKCEWTIEGKKPQYVRGDRNGSLLSVHLTWQHRPVDFQVLSQRVLSDTPISFLHIDENTAALAYRNTGAEHYKYVFGFAPDNLLYRGSGHNADYVHLVVDIPSGKLIREVGCNSLNIGQSYSVNQSIVVIDYTWVDKGSYPVGALVTIFNPRSERRNDKDALVLYLTQMQYQFEMVGKQWLIQNIKQTVSNFESTNEWPEELDLAWEQMTNAQYAETLRLRYSELSAEISDEYLAERFHKIFGDGVKYVPVPFIVSKNGEVRTITFKYLD